MQFASGSVAHGLIGQDFGVTDVDRAYADLLGRDRDRILGRSAIDFLHPDDRLPARKYLRRAFASEATISTTQRMLRRDGNAVWVNLHISRIGVGDTALLAVTCVPLPSYGLPSEVESQWQMAHMLVLAFDGAKRAFGDSLIGNPATEFLLLAYLAEAEGRATRAGELADRINVAWPLAQRWLLALSNAEFIECERAGPFSPETPVRLSPRALSMIEALFGALYAAIRGAPVLV